MVCLEFTMIYLAIIICDARQTFVVPISKAIDLVRRIQIEEIRHGALCPWLWAPHLVKAAVIVIIKMSDYTLLNLYQRQSVPSDFLFVLLVFSF